MQTEVTEAQLEQASQILAKGLPPMKPAPKVRIPAPLPIEARAAVQVYILKHPDWEAKARRG